MNLPRRKQVLAVYLYRFEQPFVRFPGPVESQFHVYYKSRDIFKFRD